MYIILHILVCFQNDKSWFICTYPSHSSNVLHCMVGKIDHFFFSKLRAEKNGPCNTDSPRLLVDYWETKLLWQNYVIFHIIFIYIKHTNQTNEVQALSVMMKQLKEVSRYRNERNSTSFQPHVQWVRLWRAVLDKVILSCISYQKEPYNLTVYYSWKAKPRFYNFSLFDLL